MITAYQWPVITEFKPTIGGWTWVNPHNHRTYHATDEQLEEKLVAMEGAGWKITRH